MVSQVPISRSTAGGTKWISMSSWPQRAPSTTKSTRDLQPLQPQRNCSGKVQSLNSGTFMCSRPIRSIFAVKCSSGSVGARLRGWISSNSQGPGTCNLVLPRATLRTDRCRRAALSSVARVTFRPSRPSTNANNSEKDTKRPVNLWDAHAQASRVDRNVIGAGLGHKSLAVSSEPYGHSTADHDWLAAVELDAEIRP